MIWTREKPTAPGWYWHRYIAGAAVGFPAQRVQVLRLKRDEYWEFTPNPVFMNGDEWDLSRAGLAKRGSHASPSPQQTP